MEHKNHAPEHRNEYNTAPASHSYVLYGLFGYVIPQIEHPC